MQIKAVACERPATIGLPLSRMSVQDVTRRVKSSGIVAMISRTTVWRILHEDAIRPWFHRSWIFPRDPQFAEKAGRVLDLYHRIWEDKPLTDDEYVISADEKTAIQILERRHPVQPPAPGMPMKVEHEYRRHGTMAYLAAMDVHRMRLFGRCEPKTGIAPFDALVDQIMAQEPYRTAKRVYLVVDNGTSHRGEKSVRHLQSRHKNLKLVHGPIHASWLNQIEIYFSILQRKVLTPNDARTIEERALAICNFERHYESIAKPFEWRFTRDDLTVILHKLEQRPKPNAA